MTPEVWLDTGLSLARNSEPITIIVSSLITRAKSNFLTNVVTESSSSPRTVWKTLNSSLHRIHIQFIHWHTRHTMNCQLICCNFLVPRLNAFVPNFLHPIPLILSVFQLSLLQIYLISIRPLSQKFVISFSLLRANNVNLTQESYLSFETLFWRTWPYDHCYQRFFSIWRHLSIFIQTSNRLSSTQKTFSSWWWSQRLSSYF